MSRLRLFAALVAIQLPAAAIAAVPAKPAPPLVRYPAGRLGGVSSVFRYAVARPDRAETRYLFLSGKADGAEPPEEVQVLGPGGRQTQLSDQDGADCTLAHVEVVPAPRALVVAAVRSIPAGGGLDDQSQPAPFEIQLYRPGAGEDAGESRIVLRAAGAPVRTAPLCGIAQVRAAMLRIASTQGR